MNNKERPCNILLVDDDADDRAWFLEALNEIDPAIKCMTAKDGAQALTYLEDPESVLPDYIFLDLRMPKINGRQCLSRIKANGRLQQIPVIFYTTSSEVEDSREMESLGAVHFITKPSNQEEIYFVLSLVLEEQWNNDAWQRGKI